MQFLIGLLSVFFLSVVYNFSMLIVARSLHINHRHYFFGSNPAITTFNLFGIRITLGLYIPLLSKIYCVEDKGKIARYPWEFFKYSVGKRFILTISGALSMLVVGVMIFIVAAYVIKEEIITKNELNKYGIYPSELAKKYGFETGDKILAINKRDFEHYYELLDPAVFQRKGNTYLVSRNGHEFELSTKDTTLRESRPFLSPNVPFDVGRVLVGSPAEEAGIKKGDRILKVNNQPVTKFYDMQEEFDKDIDHTVQLVIQRENGQSTEILQKTVVLNDENRMGFAVNELIIYTVKERSFPRAIVTGSTMAFRTFVQYFTSRFNNPRSSRTVSGPVGVVAFDRQSFFIQFMNYAAYFAIFCVAWNMLPFPKSIVLEIVPLIYERTTSKTFPFPKFRLIREVSIFLIIGIFLWGLISDLLQLFF